MRARLAGRKANPKTCQRGSENRRASQKNKGLVRVSAVSSLRTTVVLALSLVVRQRPDRISLSSWRVREATQPCYENNGRFLDRGEPLFVPSLQGFTLLGLIPSTCTLIMALQLCHARPLEYYRVNQLVSKTHFFQRSWRNGVVRFVRPFLAYKIFGRVSPVLASYKITHKCNLKCRHCPYWKRPSRDQNFREVVATLHTLRSAGVLILIIEGGEPLLWKDGGLDIRDVVWTARKFFPSVCMTTNGTLPWGDLPVNRVWVSLDGPEQMNDSLRGEGVFGAIFRNIEGSAQAHRVFVSTTINALNLDSIPELISFLRGRVAGVTIQFYYPYQGLPDPLFVGLDERRRLLNRLIEMKKHGFPIVNTERSMKQFQKSRWLCEDRLLANADPDGTISYGCYLKNRGPSVCELCGFTAHNEMSLAFHGNIASIRTGLDTFFH